MAVALGSTGTFLAYANGVTNSAIPVPASVAAGDVIVIYFYLDTTSVSVTAPSGFSELTFSPTFGVASPFMACHVFWKVATGADTGTYTVTHSSTSTQGIALRFTGCDQTTPIEVLGSSNNSASTSAPPAITGTTSRANELLSYAAFIFAGTPWTTISGWTDAQNGAGQYNAVKTQATTGTTGAITATNSSSNATMAALIGLMPPLPSIPLVDTGAGADALTVPKVGPQLAETGSGVDALTVTTVVPVADTGSGADALGTAVPVALPGDTGAGVDALTVPKVGPQLAETGSGVDAISLPLATKSLSDTGTAVDALTISALAPLPADTGAGVDALVATNHAGVADTGAGVDALTISRRVILLADAGTAVDAVLAQGGYHLPGTVVVTAQAMGTVTVAIQAMGTAAVAGAPGTVTVPAQAMATAVVATT